MKCGNGMESGKNRPSFFFYLLSILSHLDIGLSFLFPTSSMHVRLYLWALISFLIHVLRFPSWIEILNACLFVFSYQSSTLWKSMFVHLQCTISVIPSILINLNLNFIPWVYILKKSLPNAVHPLLVWLFPRSGYICLLW